MFLEALQNQYTLALMQLIKVLKTKFWNEEPTHAPHNWQSIIKLVLGDGAASFLAASSTRILAAQGSAVF